LDLGFNDLANAGTISAGALVGNIKSDLYYNLASALLFSWDAINSEIDVSQNMNLGSHNLTTTGTGTFGSAKNTNQLIVKANKTQTATTAVIAMQNSSGTELIGIRTNPVLYGYSAGLFWTGGSRLVEQRSSPESVNRMLYAPNGDVFEVLNEAGNSFMFGVYGNNAYANANSIISYYDFVIGSGYTGIDYKLTFNGETNDGVITWMEDEDYFKFSDDITTTRTIYNKADNSKHFFGTDNDASISYDGTNLKFVTNATGNGIAWFSSDVSAHNLIDRSWYWDDNLGSSLDYVKDSKTINLDKDLPSFEQATYQVTDFSRPVENEVTEEFCSINSEDKVVCKNETRIETIYPYKIEETGRLVSATIGKHEQNIYDLLKRLETAENKLNKICAKQPELCKY